MMSIENICIADEKVAMKFTSMTENLRPQKAKNPVTAPTPRVTIKNCSDFSVEIFVDTKALPAITVIALAPITNHC